MSKKSFTTITSAVPTRLQSLDSLLSVSQSMRLIFILDEQGRADIYSPNKKLPMSIRRAVHKFNRELYKLLMRCDKAVCPARSLHSRSWRSETGVCCVCKRLQASFEQVTDNRKTA